MTSQPKIRVVYHDNCLDGVVAAAAVGLRIGLDRGDQMNFGALRAYDDVEFVNATYEKPHEKFDASKYAADTVYIVDFSFSRENIAELCRRSWRVVLIDHHMTAAANLGLETIGENGTKTWSKAPGMPANFEFVFDILESGASLAWRHLHPSRPTPELVKFARDYDLWIHEFAESKAIAVARGVEKWTPGDAMARIVATPQDKPADRNSPVMRNAFLAKSIDAGTAMVRLQLEQAKEIAENAIEIEIDGVKAYAVDAPGALANEVGAVLCARGDGVAFVYSQRANAEGPYYKVSMRSQKKLMLPDVGAIAVKHGGGGHRDSASFTTTAAGLHAMLSNRFVPANTTAPMMRPN